MDLFNELFQPPGLQRPVNSADLVLKSDGSADYSFLIASPASGGFGPENAPPAPALLLDTYGTSGSFDPNQQKSPPRKLWKTLLSLTKKSRLKRLKSGVKS